MAGCLLFFIVISNFCILQKSRTDASNFDRQFTAEHPTLTPIDSAIVNNITQDEFRGFSFVNEDFGHCSASANAGDAELTDNVNETKARESSAT